MHFWAVGFFLANEGKVGKTVFLQSMDPEVVKELHVKLQRPDGSIPKGAMSAFVSRAIKRALLGLDQKHLKLCAKCVLANQDVVDSKLPRAEPVAPLAPINVGKVENPFAHLLDGIKAQEELLGSLEKLLETRPDVPQ